jgi:lipopolysaccharide transport system ATP-binding protein
LVDDVNVINEEGRLVFAAHNVASNYYNKTRLPGLYRSTAWIPGNLLTEGGYSITAGVITLSPFCFHARAENAVSVRLVDTMSGHSARGVHAAEFPGVIRPLLRWDVAEAFADSADVPQPLAAAAGK